MEAMIAEILETERLQSPHGGLHRRRVDLAGLVQAVSDSFRDRVPSVMLSRPAPPLWLHIDSDRIQTAVRNVVENAVKYSNPAAPSVDVSVVSEQNGAAVRVRNRGNPIPAQELPLLFEPFYRVDKSRSKETGGYGLGLSLCRTIFEMHGGTATLTSDDRDGTVVTLWLPAGTGEEFPAKLQPRSIAREG